MDTVLCDKSKTLTMHPSFQLLEGISLATLKLYQQGLYHLVYFKVVQKYINNLTCKYMQLRWILIFVLQMLHVF